jgi:hypothetical protein
MDETMEESVKKGHESQILKELSQHVALLENLGNLYNERYFMTHIKSYEFVNRTTEGNHYGLYCIV